MKVTSVAWVLAGAVVSSLVACPFPSGLCDQAEDCVAGLQTCVDGYCENVVGPPGYNVDDVLGPESSSSSSSSTGGSSGTSGTCGTLTVADTCQAYPGGGDDLGQLNACLSANVNKLSNNVADVGMNDCNTATLGTAFWDAVAYVRKPAGTGHLKVSTTTGSVKFVVVRKTGGGASCGLLANGTCIDGPYEEPDNSSEGLFVGILAPRLTGVIASADLMVQLLP